MKEVLKDLHFGSILSIFFVIYFL